MKSIVLRSQAGRGDLKSGLEEMEVPVPGLGELVVRMEACGLCGTDLEKMRGEYTASMPLLGHEAAGVISAVGDGVTAFRVGDRVFPHHHVPCYECYVCKAGDDTMCDMYRKSNIHPGGFSEYFRVPEWNVAKGGVLPLPNEVTFEEGALIEPTACCLRGIRRHARAGETVLVVGAGPVGLMHALLLEPMEVKLVISDISGPRLDFAERMRLGAVLDASKDDVPGRLRAETQGRGADLAIVASGSRAAIMQALASIRKGGRVCLFGVPPRGSVLGYDISDLYNSGQQIVTSYGANEVDTKAAMGIISSNPDFARLVTHRFPLSRFEDAVGAATGGEAMKVLVTP
ncbi:MAG TPA: alcohol dehydrogenase catalytic domain-containing protein [Nitrososphaerales archaeon]|nr:alcohol dehydrogenase catalytic domain-containing protein [Nitrososphaerales archaeon]